ncbi:MAG: 6,7-dimethyl-8-ribityllumazine synthase [Gemmatimonadetes bacterium]|nr:6,7-dimethyl-8-ribityllumazine synthase [Gemmatimonadota bacterium]
MASHEGATAGGRRTKVCVIVSRFNREVTERLLEGAATELLRNGIAEKNLDVVYVPGAWELPLAARGAARDGYDAIVALGCVIRGETAHFDHVGRAATDGLARVQLDSEVPVGLGVLTPDTLEQALARAGGELGNAGTEAARAALRMADLQRQCGW